MEENCYQQLFIWIFQILYLQLRPKRGGWRAKSPVAEGTEDC